jgi:hypothetical protein
MRGNVLQEVSRWYNGGILIESPPGGGLFITLLIHEQSSQPN